MTGNANDKTASETGKSAEESWTARTTGWDARTQSAPGKSPNRSTPVGSAAEVSHVLRTVDRYYARQALRH